MLLGLGSNAGPLLQVEQTDSLFNPFFTHWFWKGEKKRHHPPKLFGCEVLLLVHAVAKLWLDRGGKRIVNWCSFTPPHSLFWELMFNYMVIVSSSFNSLFSCSRGSVHGCTLSTTTWCLYLVSDGLITASCFTDHCHNLLLLCPVLSGCPWGHGSHSISAALKQLFLLFAIRGTL